MNRIKIAVIGAGSTYTPELIEGLIKLRDELPLKAISLMDIDRRKLEIVGGLAKRMLDTHGVQCDFILTEDLDEAVRGSDFVVGQIRVGGLEARVKDEKIPLKYGLIGQETTGIGGFLKAMRTIPAVMEIAHSIEKNCPDAWFINFSNPSGIIAEAVLNHTGVKMIGLCNSPTNMKLDVLKKLPAHAGTPEFEFVGLNHLVWITRITCDGKDMLKEMLAGKSPVPFAQNIIQVEMDETLLAGIGAIPSSYLSYYYCRDAQMKKLLEAPECRAETCLRIQRELLEEYDDPNLSEKPSKLDQRGGHSYSKAAISLISAIHNDKNEIHVVDVKNNRALEFMEDSDVVEIGCNVNRNGATPVPVRQFQKEHIIGLMRVVKSYEKLAVKAGLEGSYGDALNALIIHPLIGDYAKAKGALDELLQAHRDYLPQFFRQR